jgi:hypothetical protein
MGGVHKNPMGYLTFLSALALLGPVTGNYYILGFLGFLGFMPILLGKDADERFDINVNKACRNAFTYFVATNSLFSVYMAITRDLSIIPLMLVAELLGSMTLFTASHAYYDRKGE